MRRIVIFVVAALALLIPTLVYTTSGASAVEDPGGGVFVPVAPAQVVNATTWTGGAGSFIAGETRNYTVAGNFGVPSTGVSAVVMNLAAYGTTATTSSYLTMWAYGATRPVVSSLYYDQSNVPRSNTVIVPLGTGGKVSLYNYTGTTNVVAYVQGYFTTTSSSSSTGGFVALDAPERVANTNTGYNVTAGTIGVGQTRDIDVLVAGDIDPAATSVFANIEVADATVNGTLRVGPGGTTLSGSPAMSYGTDGRYDSGVSIRLNSSGVMRIENTTGSAVNIKVDVQGFWSGDSTEGGSFVPMTPTNVYSTTSSGQTDLGGGDSREVPIAGVAGLPNDGSLGAVVLTVQVKNWTAGGTVTVYPAGMPWPGVSNVGFNYNEGDPANGMSSTAITAVSDDGYVSIHNTSVNAVRITLTAQGWFKTSTPDDGDGADPADPDAVAPVGTIYAGVNSDELDDLTSIAQNEGISTSQAVTDYGSQSDFTAAASEVEAANPTTFAYAQFADDPADPPTIAFTGTSVPSEAEAAVAGLGDVNLVDNAPYSSTQVDAMVDSADASVAALEPANAEVVTSADAATGAITADVYVPAGNTQSTTALRSAAQARIAADEPAVTVPGVTINVSEEPVETDDALQGGVALVSSLPDARGLYTHCTSGFPAYDFATGAEGILTAGHCGTVDLYAAKVKPPRYAFEALQAPTMTLSTNYGDMEFLPSVGYPVGHSFYVGVGKKRLLYGDAEVYKGEYICIFGRTSNGVIHGKKTCAKVESTSITETTTTGEVRHRLIRIAGQTTSQPGDSGGPAYIKNYAVGVISGTGGCPDYSVTNFAPNRQCTYISAIAGNEDRGSVHVGLNSANQ